MLTIQECGFIAASSRSPTMCFVASVAGAAITKWSALPQISSIRSTGQRAVAAGAGDRDHLDVVRLEHVDQRAADPARADDRDRRALERPLGPRVPRLRARVVREPAHAGDQQPERELGDLRGVGAGGRGELHVRRRPAPAPATARRPRRAAAPSAPIAGSSGRSSRAAGPDDAPRPPRARRARRRRRATARIRCSGSSGPMWILGAISSFAVRLARLPPTPRAATLATMSYVPQLAVRGLTKSFGGRAILRGARPRRRGRLADRHPRPQRRREVDAAADRRRPRPPRRRAR